MARRSDHSRDELYRMALEAARKLVQEGEARNLTARNVSKIIGYSPGTLYNLFSNLSDLVMHMNAQSLDDMYDHLHQVTISGEAEADLKALADLYLIYVSEHSSVWNMLFDTSMPGVEALPDWYLQKVGRLFGLIEAALVPLFPDDQALARAQSARVLWSSFHGIVSLAGSGKLSVITEHPAKLLTDNLIETYLAGVKRLS